MARSVEAEDRCGDAGARLVGFAGEKFHRARLTSLTSLTSLSSAGAGLVAGQARRRRTSSLQPVALAPQPKLSSEDATLQAVRRCWGRREPDERQDHPEAIGEVLDPVAYRPEQISWSGIGQQSLPQLLCFSHDAEYRLMTARL